MKKTFLLLLLILIIAGFFRLYQITTIPPGLYPDEAMNGNNALQALYGGADDGGFSAQSGPASGWKVFYPENNGREGLFINIQALFLKFFVINEPWVLRLPSAIFGILTVLGVYFLAKELFSTRVALLSAFFIATSFWHILFSRIGFRAIMAPLFLVWAVYFLVKTLKSAEKNSSPNFYYLISIISGVIYGLGFYSYIAYRITPVLILFIMIFYWFTNKDSAVRKKLLISIFSFLISAFIVALPLGIYYLQHPADFMGRTTQVSVFSSPSPLADLGTNIAKTLRMFNFSGDWNWRHNYAGNPELFWPVGIMFLIGTVFAVKNIVRNEKSEMRNEGNFGYWVLFLWFALAMLPVVISNEGIPHALRSILMIPPVMILAGIGGVWIYEMLKKYLSAYWTRAIIAFFAAFIVSSAYQSYFVVWANNPNVQGAFAADYVALGRELNNLPASTPKYVIVQAGGVLVNGIPMPAQTAMFITGTYLPEWQKAKNIYYVLPDEEKNIPTGTDKFYIR